MELKVIHSLNVNAVDRYTCKHTLYYSLVKH